jgi:hypothetical protein
VTQPEIFKKNIREYVQLSINYIRATRGAQRSAKTRA